MEAREWRCGHPRVPENTSGSEKQQCRACKTAHQRDQYANNPEYRARQLARTRRAYDALDGVGYNRRLLQIRRQKALARRRQRGMEV